MARSVLRVSRRLFVARTLFTLTVFATLGVITQVALFESAFTRRHHVDFALKTPPFDGPALWRLILLLLAALWVVHGAGFLLVRGPGVARMVAGGLCLVTATWLGTAGPGIPRFPGPEEILERADRSLLETGRAAWMGEAMYRGLPGARERCREYLDHDDPLVRFAGAVLLYEWGRMPIDEIGPAVLDAAEAVFERAADASWLTPERAWRIRCAMGIVPRGKIHRPPTDDVVADFTSWWEWLRLGIEHRMKR
jgi:hypothetical protein